MHRLFTAAVFVLWLSAMAALFVRDVLPSWTAQNAPPLRPDLIAPLGLQEQQYGIFLGDGTRIGTAWGKVEASATTTTVQGTVFIECRPLVNGIRIETNSKFDSSGTLEAFNLWVYGVRLPGVRRGPGMQIWVHGERLGIYFPCELHFGAIHKEANLDVSASRLIGDSLRPVAYLPSLSVGQSWRMQILDPLAAALRGKTQFKSIIARVTGTEIISVQDGEIECFVVETSPDKTKAWVDKLGCVRKQEVELPGLGVVRICEEEYRENLRLKAIRDVPARSDNDR
ncbi:MAG: hypothetical protein KA354_09580 [Phycisphaerae bacterium]|nr:hypothetical protein [Phycisphaerae bacterium]